MRKLICCFLLLFAFTGCTQQVQEQPEEPPTVEEPGQSEELDEDGDNEQDTIKYVEKIANTNKKIIIIVLLIICLR